MKNNCYNILVVDDEIDLHDLFRKRFRELIKQGTLNFEFANNGREALELIQSEKIYHILFTDIRMPVMDGLTLLSHLKDLKTVVKTVVISAYDDISNIRTAMNRDAFDFLVKPISLDDLSLTLDKTIREYDVYMEGIEAAKNLAKAIKEKEEAVHKERQRLSRDLHDDIGSTLSSINIISNMMLRNDLLNHPDESGEKLKSSVEKINERSQRLLDNMSDIVWSVNPENDAMEEVLARMRMYATTVLEAKGINYNIDFPTSNIDYKLPLDVKNNLYLIFKEAVNNLAKYSNASQANVKVKVNEGILNLIIEDNGVGFTSVSTSSGLNSEAKSGGNGLRNMQSRADEIKADLKIESELSVGTTVMLQLTIS